MDERFPRVAFVSHSGKVGGGAERLLLELVTALTERSVCTPMVVTPDEGDLADAVRDTGAVVARADYGWWCSNRATETRRCAAAAGRQAFYCARTMWPSARRVSLVLKDFSPDVVVSNTCVIPAGALAAAGMRVPHVWLAQEYGREDFRLAFFLGYGPSMRLLGMISTVVVAISRALGHALSPYASPEKIEVLHAACVTPTGSPVEARAKDEPLRLLILGRGVPGKGVEDAIRGLGIARSHGVDARLRIAGPTSAADAEAFGRLAVSAGVQDAVTVIGYVEDPVAEIDDAHIALTCSRSEAFGRVTVEYLRRGRPVIGTRSGGTPELVEDGVTGFLYEPGDTAALAGRMELLASSNARLTEMSNAAIERNAHRFLLSDYVNRFTRILERARSQGSTLWRPFRRGR